MCGEDDVQTMEETKLKGSPAVAPAWQTYYFKCNQWRDKEPKLVNVFFNMIGKTDKIFKHGKSNAVEQMG